MITMEADVAMQLENDIVAYQTAIGAVNDEETFIGIIERFRAYEDSHIHGTASIPFTEARRSKKAEASHKKENDAWWRKR